MQSNPTLDEARRIAGQPMSDRLEGKQGEEAYNAVLRLLEEAGLDYAEALRLMAARDWQKWNEGWTIGYHASKGN